MLLNTLLTKLNASIYILLIIIIYTWVYSWLISRIKYNFFFFVNILVFIIETLRRIKTILSV